MSLPTAASEGKQLLKKFMLRTAVRLPRISAAHFVKSDQRQVLRLYRSLYRHIMQAAVFIRRFLNRFAGMLPLWEKMAARIFVNNSSRKGSHCVRINHNELFSYLRSSKIIIRSQERHWLGSH